MIFYGQDFSKVHDSKILNDSQRFTYRLVGFRGDWNNWDWDSAIVDSEGKSRMMNTSGRANYDLLDAALAKSYT